GGMAQHDLLAQDLADVLGIAVERPANVESSALGAAMLAAVGAGLHPTLEEASAAMRGQSATFAPAMTAEHRAARLERWDRAVAAVILAGSSCSPVPRTGCAR
ncbi:MAG TPA: FGGY-family carbohydrate kinase, partial [Sphingomicrobium sp.]|nr:FGGY-family carbohydrate kinase [Sphingomicrobium sp.]